MASLAYLIFRYIGFVATFSASLSLSLRSRKALPRSFFILRWYLPQLPPALRCFFFTTRLQNCHGLNIACRNERLSFRIGNKQVNEQSLTVPPHFQISTFGNI